MNHTHQTARTQFVEANGIRFAYRRFGKTGGVRSNSGEVPTAFEQMAANAIAFIKALGLKQVDLFGFSIGGLVVQEITLQAPGLVRRLIVDGAGPRGGQGMELLTQAAWRVFGA